MATIHDPIKAEIAAGHTSAAVAWIDSLNRKARPPRHGACWKTFWTSTTRISTTLEKKMKAGLKTDITYRHTYI